MQAKRVLFLLATIFLSTSFGLDYFDATLASSGFATLVIDNSTQTYNFTISTTIANPSMAGIYSPSGTLLVSFTILEGGIVQNVTNGAFPVSNFLALIATQESSVFVSNKYGQIAGNFTNDCLNGVLEPTGCSCYSGFTGDSYCDTNSLGTCTLGSVDPLITETVAEFMKSLSSISSSNFIFVIDSTGRNDRYFSSLYLNSPSCGYPSSYFHKDFNSSSCTDSFTGTFPLSILNDTCHFTEDVQPSITYLSGAIYLTAVDALPSLRGQALQRTTSSLLRLRLGIPTAINVTSNATTLVAPSSTIFVAAVTFQSYDEESQVGIIQVTTVIEWPFFISGVILNYQSTSLDVEVTITNNTLCNQTNVSSDCVQVSTLTFGGLDPSNGCDFSGLYDVTWTYALRSGATESFTVPSPYFYTNVTVSSGQVCATIDIDANIKGTLTAYASSDFSSTSVTFIADTTIFFLASVTTDVDLQSVTVINLSVTQGTTTTYIVQNQVPVAASANYNGSIPSPSPSEAAFSFSASYGTDPSDILYSSDGESAVTFSVQADLQVTYLTTFGRKRDTQKDTIKVTQDLVLDATQKYWDNQSVQNANSAASLSFGFAPLVIGFAGYAAAN